MKLIMPLFRILPFLICFSSLAQVNITIENEAQNGFLLGVNGYAQNDKPVSVISIKGLDTVPTQLLIQLEPSISFTKIIHLHESGNYKYIITTNSRDELQLRYRGTLPKLPEGELAMNVKRENLMPQSQPIVTATVSSQPSVTPPVIVETPQPVVPTKEIVESKELQDTISQIASSEGTGNLENRVDTKQIFQESTAEIVEVVPVDPFSAFIDDLLKTEFEFEKLQKSEAFAHNHRYTIDELKQVFNILSYDNSRLQLVRSIKGTFEDISQMKILAEQLDYEISRQQLEEILKS